MDHIVYITDEQYCMPTCVSIQSLIENKDRNTIYAIYVLTFDISNNSKNHLSAISGEGIEIIIIEMNNTYKKLYENEYITYVCKKFNLNPTEIVTEWKEKFGTYSKFKKWLNE